MWSLVGGSFGGASGVSSQSTKECQDVLVQNFWRIFAYVFAYLPKMPPCSAMLRQTKKREPISDSVKKNRTSSRFLMVDSTPLPGCHNVRVHRYKTFKGEANWAHL